eukprot:365819-Chlamydomonas_euryale.AAC.15
MQHAPSFNVWRGSPSFGVRVRRRRVFGATGLARSWVATSRERRGVEGGALVEVRCAYHMQRKPWSDNRNNACMGCSSLSSLACTPARIMAHLKWARGSLKGGVQATGGGPPIPIAIWDGVGEHWLAHVDEPCGRTE